MSKIWRPENYRRHTQECRDRAAFVSNRSDKEMWLRTAREFDDMALRASRSHTAQMAKQPTAAPEAAS